MITGKPASTHFVAISYPKELRLDEPMTRIVIRLLGRSIANGVHINSTQQC
jgi:hypothetical protein